MYNSKLSVCIKAAGKVLREQKDQVYVPFGSEYSIYLKNLNTVRALVRINLDGVDVTDGTDLVIQPNSSIDLERFMKAGNLSQGNRFKFIERTSKVEAHRGIQAEDGLLRVEFQFERLQSDWTEAYKQIKEVHHYHHRDYWPYNRISWRHTDFYGDSTYGYGACNNLSFGGAITNSATTLNAGVATSVNTMSCSTSASSGVLRNDCSAPTVNEAGITVPGSVSTQAFTRVAAFPVETEKHVIVLKLLGETNTGQVVTKAVTVKHSQTCKTCGTRNRGKLAQFCRDCGTALEIA